MTDTTTKTHFSKFLNPARGIGPLVAIAGATFVASLGTSIVPVALPSFAAFFMASLSEVQWIVLGYLVSGTAVVFFAGLVGDRIGQRKSLLLGLGVYIASSVLCMAAPALWLLVLGRVIQGVGGAMMMAGALSLAPEAVGKERTGRAMGLIATMSAVGTAAGPVLGGFILAFAGWPGLFASLELLGAAALFAVKRYLPAGLAEQQPGRLAMAALRDRVLLLSGIMNVLVSAVMMATLIVGPIFLAGALGLDTWAIGLVMAVGPVFSALSAYPAGLFADRFGPKAMVVAGLLGLAGASVGLLLLPVEGGVVAYICAIIPMTVSYALFQTSNNAQAIKGALSGRGAYAGVLQLSRNLGLMAGSWVMAAVFSMAAGAKGHQSPQSVGDGMHASFGLAALLIAVAIGAAAAIPKNKA